MQIRWWQLRHTALAVTVVIAALAALAWYLTTGNTNSPSAAGETNAIMGRLGAYFEKQPSDARAWVLHARRLAEAERFDEAAQAYEKALALPSKAAKDPAVWCEYADALAMTRQGRLDGKPRELIAQALALNPDHPKALEMSGSAEYAAGNYAAALAYWRPLLAQLTPGSPMHGELAIAIARTERLAATSLANPAAGRQGVR